MGPVLKLSAEMFTFSVSVATAAGGLPRCEETRVRTSVHISILIYVSVSVGAALASVTVVSMETSWTFADVGVDLASAGRSVLTGRRQAVIHRCKQPQRLQRRFFHT